MIEIRYPYPIPGLRDRMVSSGQLTTREAKSKIKKLKARRGELEAEVCALQAKLEQRSAECAVLHEQETYLQQEIDGR